MPQDSTEDEAKSNFLGNIYSEYILTPYSQGAQEINFKLHSFETPQKLMGQWKNLNNRCCTVTDGPLAVQICRGCTVDHKKKNPHCPLLSIFFIVTMNFKICGASSERQ